MDVYSFAGMSNVLDDQTPPSATCPSGILPVRFSTPASARRLLAPRTFSSSKSQAITLLIVRVDVEFRESHLGVRIPVGGFPDPMASIG